MKKFILIIIVLISNTVIGQTVLPIEDYFESNNMYINNVYFKDVNNTFNKFIGTWEYNQNGHYVKLKVNKLIKVRLYKDMKNVRFADKLVCSFIYKYNGTEIYNTFLAIGENVYTAKYFIDGHYGSGSTSVDLFYSEPSANTCGRTKKAKINLTYLSTTNSQPKKIIWQRINLIESQGIGCATDDYDTSEFKIPASMSFSKIE